jgi:anti-anti-sigma factor
VTTEPLAAVIERHGHTPVVRLRGEIDATAEATLDAAYADATRDGGAALVLAFGEVGYINSSGIALIVRLLGQARRDHRRIAACGLSDHYREIFEITRVADFMEMFPDEGTALAAMDDNPT